MKKRRMKGVHDIYGIRRRCSRVRLPLALLSNPEAKNYPGSALAEPPFRIIESW